jgi:hypothetical protein
VGARRGPTVAVFLLALAGPVLWLAPALVSRQALSFRDQGDFFYPLKLYTAGRLLARDVPLWNPLSGGGEPWLANAQSGVFYPPTWLFALPSPALAAALFLLVHFALGAWGAFRFLQDEGATAPAALSGAALFAGSGFAASLATYWNHFGAFMYLPAVAAVARGGLRSRRSIAGLGLLIGFQAMAGSPEMSGATLAVAALLSLFPRPPLSTGWAQEPRWRPARRSIAGALLGLALAGWVLLPLGELVLRSDRREALPAAEREAGAVGAAALASLVRIGSDSGTAYLASLSLGPVGLALAALAFTEKQRRPLALLLLVLAAAGVVAAAAGPPGSWLRSLPPLDRIRYPAKALALTFFAVPMLAGLGCDRLRFSTLRLPWLGAALAWAAAAAVTVFGALAGRELFTFVDEAEIRRPPESLGPLARVSGRVLTPPMRDMARWVLQDSRFDASALRRQREVFLGYTNLLYGVSTVRTAAPLPAWEERAVADAMDSAESPVRAAGAAGGRVLVTTFPPPEMGSRKAGEIYRAPINPFRPRLAFVAGFEVEPDARRAWQRVARGESDPSLRVLLDRPPSPALPPPRSTRPSLVARFADDLPQRVVVDMTSDSAGLLVLADLYYPGWSAEVDGRPAPILRADGLFRAVALPPDSHRVVFRYRPLSVLAGAGLSAAAAIAMLALLRSRDPEPA